MRLKVAAAVALAALVGVPAALAGPSLKIGAVEDAAKWSDPVAQMNLAKQAGFAAVRMPEKWRRGETPPPPGEVAALRGAAAAAVAAGIEPVVAVYNTGSSKTP